MPGFSRQGALDASFALDIMTFMGSQFNTSAALNTTLAAGLLTGAAEVYLNTTANGANGLTTRTAGQLYADLQSAAGLQNINNTSYMLRIINTGNGTVTLTGGAGVTITGPATIATNTFRDYIVTVTNNSTITLQSVGVGTAP